MQAFHGPDIDQPISFDLGLSHCSDSLLESDLPSLLPSYQQQSRVVRSGRVQREYVTVCRSS